MRTQWWMHVLPPYHSHSLRQKQFWNPRKTRGAGVGRSPSIVPISKSCVICCFCFSFLKAPRINKGSISGKGHTYAVYYIVLATRKSLCLARRLIFRRKNEEIDKECLVISYGMPVIINCIVDGPRCVSHG